MYRLHIPRFKSIIQREDIKIIDDVSKLSNGPEHLVYSDIFHLRSQ